MPTNISVGDTINLTAQFLSNDVVTDDEVVLDPDSISGNIYKYNSNTSTYVAYATFTPTETDPGYFEYDWVTPEAGKFQVDFVAVFGVNPPVTNRRFIFVGAISTTDTLDNSVTFNFLTELDPLFLDPEAVLPFYAEADLVEVAELIHWYSSQLLYILNVTSITDVTPLMRDYVLASVLCDLSKIYFFGGGLGGFNTADSFTLGDLAVKSGSGTSTSSSSSSSNGGISTWCELAALLKDQLTYSKSTMTPYVRGSVYINPIPSRALRRVD